MSVTQRIARLALVCAIASAAVVAGPPSRATATHPGNTGRLALACEDGLWTVDSDGTDWSHVTAGQVLDPAWSPGGTRFAFTRQTATDKTNLFTMNADGTNVRQLTYTVGSDLDPDWSPDATRIAYSSTKSWAAPPGRTVWIYLYFSGFSRSFPPYLGDPVFNPDDNHTFAYVDLTPGAARRIYFNRDDWYEPWTVVTPPAGAHDESPDWAPGGDRYLFVRLQDGIRSVWAVDLDGTDQVRLTDATVDVREPRYAPDGTVIAYLARPAAEAGTTAPFDLWTMGTDGSGKQQVASDLNCSHLSWQPQPAFPLVDARFRPFRAEIEWAFAEGITTGCNPEQFCATDGVTREQMASFLARALDLPAATKDYFTDDEASIHEANINRIAEAGITTGCSAGLYCPRNWVTREEMASFLARAFDLPPATGDYFTDDETSIHESNINRIAEAGITSGCTLDTYCPRKVVTREQMVAFLYRGLAD